MVHSCKSTIILDSSIKKYYTYLFYFTQFNTLFIFLLLLLPMFIMFLCYGYAATSNEKFIHNIDTRMTSDSGWGSI